MAKGDTGSLGDKLWGIYGVTVFIAFAIIAIKDWPLYDGWSLVGHLLLDFYVYAMFWPITLIIVLFFK